MNEILTWLLDTVQSVDPAVRALIAGLAIMLETSVLVGLVVPGDTIVIVAGTAVDGFVEGAILVVVIVVGALIGESIGFWLGRLLGPKIRDSRVGGWIGRDNWDRSERYLQRRGGPAIFISRFLPVLHSLVPLTVGMSDYSYRRFLVWTTPACIIWSTAYISVSAAAAEGYRALADQLHFAAYIFVAVMVVFLLVVVLVKRLIVRSERRHLTATPDARVDADVSKGDTDDVKD